MATSVQLPLLTSWQVGYLDNCSTMSELRQHHTQLIKLGLSSDNDAVGRLIKFCALSTSGDINYAHNVFDKLPSPDAFIYNTIIRGYLQYPEDGCKNCIQLYSRMVQQSVFPNNFTFPPLIRACCNGNNAVWQGKQVHAHVIKHGFSSDSFAQNNLIYMYVSCNYLEEAKRVFHNMTDRDGVSWTTLISGYAQSGQIKEAYDIFESMPERARKNSAVWNAIISAYAQSNRFREAFALFDRMRSENVVIDKYLAASMISACTGLGALERGEDIIRYVRTSGIEIDSMLATTAMDMYCKCGRIDDALELFGSLADKGISSWNCIIGGLAMHGKGNEAVELLKKMERRNDVAPDYITFVNILSACAHSGLVDEGRAYFYKMSDVYGIEPGMEHYGCLVDLLGRAGLLEEAKMVIADMPLSPDVGVLGALLGACKIHGNIKLGVEIGKQVIELEPNNSGRYVLLANLYASGGRWEDVANVRKLMNDRGVKKTPGFSVIELEGVISEFIAGGRTHPEVKEIYKKVHEMLDQIRVEGYLPDSDEVLHDVGEEETENPLFYHSEKLAIGYGLLKTKPGETLRITKNLRVCKDCHQASKLISKVYGRQIIVRDRNRFHHFKDGFCSCNDYW
ncbi:hypothetical protein Leryth_024725 [Lithospermum erythrorhizon]|nr:hypothetical protein Leryth_024725 [Lithospermum erythrorhizon]